VTTELAALADATAMGQLLLVRNGSPVWIMAALPVDVAELDDARYEALLGLDMHSLVALTGLPAIGAAPTSANLWVEGWKETLTYGTHQMELIVSGYCRTVPPPRWDDIDPAWVWGGEDWTEQRRNLARNPIGPVGTALGWWTVARATAAVSGDSWRCTINDPLAVNHAQRINGPFPSPGQGFATAPQVIPGRTYTFSADLRANTPNVQGGANMQWYDAGGTLLSGMVGTPAQGTPLAAGGYARVVISGPAPPGAAYMYPAVGLWGTAPRTVGEWFDVRRVLIEESPAAGEWFDGDTADYAGADYAWAGGHALSESTMTGRRELARNLLPNPSAEVNLGWYSNNGAVYPAVFDPAVSHSGGQSVRASLATGQNPNASIMSLYSVGLLDGKTLPCIAGVALSAGLWMRAGSPGFRGSLYLGWLDAGGASVGYGPTPYPWTNFAAPNQWQWFAIPSVVPPANAAAFRIIATVSTVTGAAAVPVTDQAWADDAIVVVGATLPGYFDGNTPDPPGADYAWTGTANRSPSVQTEILAVAGGLPPTLTWDDATCLGPPIDLGRWDDQPATLRWDQLDPATTWNTFALTGV
jgi:hypothetical protein